MSRPQYQKRLVIMVKLPVAGQVKTRLERDVGVARATSFYRHAIRSVVRRLGPSTGCWQTLLAVAPQNAVGSSALPPIDLQFPQGSGDLGQRMGRIMQTLPPGPVVIVGSDCPTITGPHIKTAFDLLGSHDAVIGPAYDGGYWLIGLKRQPRRPHIFNNVRWSSAHTAADTLRNMSGLRVATLDALSDVDTGSDLKALAGGAGRLILPAD